MTRARANPVVVLLLLAACGGTDSPDTTGSAGAATTAPGDAAQPPGTSFGSLILRQLARTPERTWEVELAGVFPKSDPGYENLAVCALLDAPCLPQLPAVEDDWIDYNPERVFDHAQFDYAYVGPIVGLGPVDAFARNPEDGPSSYYGSATADLSLQGVQGSLDLRLSGEWGEYRGVDDIHVSPPMNAMSHDPGVEMVVHDGQRIPLEWEPRGTGEVYLRVEGRGVARTWLLEDDGYFELNVDDLGLGVSEVELEFSLARWDRARIEIAGNLLDVVAIGEARWPGHYFFVGGRTELVTADTCEASDIAQPVGTGQYWGRLADIGHANDLDPGYGGCTGYPAEGEEGFVRFDLPPLTYLTISHNLQTDDAVLYLVEDCGDASTCLDGSDTGYIAVEESVTWLNTTDREQTVYAVFDGWRTATGVFYANINLSQLAQPDMYDTCAAALSQSGSTGSGAYYGSTTAYTDQLDPAVGGCLPLSSQGPDAMTRVELQNGETLTVNVEMQGSNPALYLLPNCNTTVACKAAVDIDLGPTEQLQYTNTSGSPEALFLVVDSKAAIHPYFLTIDIQ